MKVQNPKRHAYCIIAHNEPEILKTLIELIDDSRNDIFLLVDAKSESRLFAGIKPIRSGFFLAPRVNIHWGAMSQVRAELSVLQTAYQHGPYAYYHLISGVDLPLHSQDWIHSYCDVHQGEEFIEFCSINKQVEDCAYYHHLFLEYMRCKNVAVRKFFSFLRRTVLFIEKGVGYRRHLSYELRKGSNWFSLTQDGVAYILSKEGEILTRYNHIHTPDEIVLHTVFGASPLMKRVHNLELGGGSMRKIDFTRGTPYVWTIDDLDELKQSNLFFARKFSSRHMEVVTAMRESVFSESHISNGEK